MTQHILAVFTFLIIVYLVRLLLLWVRIGTYQSYWTAVNLLQKSKKDTINYVAFGDSTAQGVGATRADFSYTSVIRRQIEKSTKRPVRLVNLSKSGHLVSDVYKKQIPEMKRLKIKPDIVTVQIGSNNILHLSDEDFEKNFQQLLNKLPKNSFVANLPWFVGRASRFAKPARRASAVIKKQTKASKNHYFVDLETATCSRWGVKMLSADLLHPSNYANKVWANTFIKEIDKKGLIKKLQLTKNKE